MPHRPPSRTIATLALALLGAACSGPGTARPVSPAPEVDAAIAAAESMAQPPADADEPADQDAPGPTSPAPPRTDAPGFLLDAMVGQVNGQPIYAAAVFEPIREQLERLGQELPRHLFRQRAGELITGELKKIVTERLVLGDAERDLSEQEQKALVNVLKELREQTIREKGEGVPIRAEERIQDESGISLQDRMAETRQAIVIKRFLERKFDPQISVSRRDIEHYYHEHIDDYRSAGGRVLRLIRARTAAAAAEIDRRLAAGEPFADVATLRLNQYKPAEGGRLNDKPSADDRLFTADELNQAMVRLQPGQYSPRIELDGQFVWIFLEVLLPPTGKSLPEVQQEIDRKLRFLQRQQLTRQYEQQLLESGSFDPIEPMALTLLEVATSRYGKPQ